MHVYVFKKTWPPLIMVNVLQNICIDVSFYVIVILIVCTSETNTKYISSPQAHICWNSTTNSFSISGWKAHLLLPIFYEPFSLWTIISSFYTIHIKDLCQERVDKKGQPSDDLRLDRQGVGWDSVGHHQGRIFEMLHLHNISDTEDDASGSSKLHVMTTATRTVTGTCSTLIRVSYIPSSMMKEAPTISLGLAGKLHQTQMALFRATNPQERRIFVF